MPRTATKWLVAWFDQDGKLKDALERTMFIRPATWAQKRCIEGETFTYWNISHTEDEKQVRSLLDRWNEDK